MTPPCSVTMVINLVVPVFVLLTEPLSHEATRHTHHIILHYQVRHVARKLARRSIGRLNGADVLKKILAGGTGFDRCAGELVGGGTRLQRTIEIGAASNAPGELNVKAIIFAGVAKFISAMCGIT